jgi:SAM-dependent methyltransferase
MTDVAAVHDFWNSASCGENLFLHGRTEIEAFGHQASERYRLEPCIATLARFDTAASRSLLEIGVGLGADHERFARAGAKLKGVDLTERAVEFTRRRFALFGLTSDVEVANAEALPFPDNSFDIVYSWGVLHHSPDTPKAFREVLRVLKPGGEARIMIYHKYSVVGYMLWLRYAFLSLRWNASLDEVYRDHLESPGTKAYSLVDAKALLAGFDDIDLRIELTHGDLLLSQAGQRHGGLLLTTARALWPRPLIRGLLKRHGLFLLMTAKKPKA